MFKLLRFLVTFNFQNYKNAHILENLEQTILNNFGQIRAIGDFLESSITCFPNQAVHIYYPNDHIYNDYIYSQF